MPVSSSVPANHPANVLTDLLCVRVTKTPTPTPHNAKGVAVSFKVGRSFVDVPDADARLIAENHPDSFLANLIIHVNMNLTGQRIVELPETIQGHTLRRYQVACAIAHAKDASVKLFSEDRVRVADYFGICRLPPPAAASRPMICVSYDSCREHPYLDSYCDQPSASVHDVSNKMKKTNKGCNRNKQSRSDDDDAFVHRW